MTPDGLVNTQTVVPLVTNANFLTLDEPTDEDAIAPATPTSDFPRATASMPPDLDFDDGDSEDDEAGRPGGMPGPFGGVGGGIPGEDDEGRAERISKGHPILTAGLAIIFGVVLA